MKKIYITVILLVFVIGVTSFIFYNSSKNPTDSYKDSDPVAEIVKPIVDKSGEKPKYEITFRDNNEDLGELGFQNKVKINYGKETLIIRRSPNQAPVNLYPERFQAGFGKLTITENSEMIESFVCYFEEKTNDFEPILVDVFLDM